MHIQSPWLPLDLLRHSAEQTLVDMLELLFSQLPQLPLDASNDNGVTTDQVLMLPSANEGIVSMVTNTAAISCLHGYFYYFQEIT